MNELVLGSLVGVSFMPMYIAGLIKSKILSESGKTLVVALVFVYSAAFIYLWAKVIMTKPNNELALGAIGLVFTLVLLIPSCHFLYSKMTNP